MSVESVKWGILPQVCFPFRLTPENKLGKVMRVLSQSPLPIFGIHHRLNPQEPHWGNMWVIVQQPMEFLRWLQGHKAKDAVGPGLIADQQPSVILFGGEFQDYCELLSQLEDRYQIRPSFIYGTSNPLPNKRKGALITTFELKELVEVRNFLSNTVGESTAL